MSTGQQAAATAGPEHEAEAFARRHFRHNATCLTVENALWMICMAITSPTTVLPAFITALGGSAVLIGLLATFQTGGWLLPQLIAARLVRGQPRSMPYLLGPLYVGRAAFFPVAAAVFLGASEPWVLIALLLLGVGVFWATDGLASVPWYDVIGKTIPADRRGRMFGVARVLGGLGGMAVGGLVADVLARPDLPFPTSYAVLFAVATGGYYFSLIPFFLIREPRAEAVARADGSERPGAREFLALLAPILRTDRTFARLVGARLLFGVVTASLSFYVLFASQEFGLGEAWLGPFVSAQVFGSLAGGLAIGYVADRFGTRVVLGLHAALGALVPVVGLGMLLAREVAPGFASSPAVSSAALALFVALGVLSTAGMIGYMTYLLEIAPAAERATYVGLFNTLVGVVLLAVPPLAGWFLVATSFGALFVVTILAALLCLVASRGLREPRHAA
jgi:MFS family permease